MSEAERLPVRQFDATDPEQLRAWIADLRERYDDDEAFERLTSVIGHMGREYQKVAAALKAKGRGQRGGGSEAFGSQAAIEWGERAEERVEGKSDAGEDGAAETDSAPDEPVERRRGHRQPFPPSWRRERVELAVTAGDRVCPICGKDKVCIGHEVSEVLAIEPAELFVKQYAREKLACVDGHAGVVTAPPEPRLVEQSACDLSVSLDLADRKLVQHQPIHRAHEVYGRLGCTVAEKTLERWFHDVLRALAVVAAAIRQAATAPERFLVNVDDTTIPILDRDAEGGRHIGHLWLVVGDQRYVAVRASRDWTKEHAVAALGGWGGYTQCDAYRGFDSLFKQGPMKEVGCWDHARRYFVKAKDRGDKLAEEALGLIARLYAVEAEATKHELAPEQRHALRRDRSRRALDLLWKWQAKVSPRTRPSSPLGKAFTYLTNQHAALERYLDDGRIPISNTLVEQQIRPIVVGRKNWLFAGSFEAAERLADGFTVVATARLHGVDPVAYLRWLLPQLARREWSEAAAAECLLPERFAQLQRADT